MFSISFEATEPSHPGSAASKIAAVTPIASFSNKLYSGNAVALAVDGSGIHFYSVPESKCVASWIVEPSLCFCSNLLYAPAQHQAAIICADKANMQSLSLKIYAEAETTIPLALPTAAECSFLKELADGRFACFAADQIFLVADGQVVDQLAYKAAILAVERKAGSDFFYIYCKTAVATVAFVGSRLAMLEEVPFAEVGSCDCFGDLFFWLTADGTAVATQEKGAGLPRILPLQQAVDQQALIKIFNENYFGVLTGSGTTLDIYESSFGLRMQSLTIQPMKAKSLFLAFDDKIVAWNEHQLCITPLMQPLQRPNFFSVLGKAACMPLSATVEELLTASTKPSVLAIGQLLQSVHCVEPISQQNIFIGNLLKSGLVSSFNNNGLLDRIIRNEKLLLLYIAHVYDLQEAEICKIMMLHLGKLPIIKKCIKKPVTGSFICKELKRCSFEEVCTLLQIVLAFAADCKLDAAAYDYVGYLIDSHYIAFLTQKPAILRDIAVQICSRIEECDKISNLQAYLQATIQFAALNSLQPVRLPAFSIEELEI